ncbi:alpha/beta hydrolase [Virgisporangium ochraceum]
MGRYRVLLVVAVGLVLVVGMLWALQRRLVYFPDRDRPAPPPGVGEIALATDDGMRLTAWLVGPSTSDTAVLVAPGNAGNRLDRLPLARDLADTGLAALLLDYRGYGGNPGDPSETGLAHDARAAWNHLTERFDRIVLYGESLGAAVVTRLATEVPERPHGLVLRSPFASLAAVGRAHYPFLPVKTLLRDRFPVAERVRAVTAPTVVVYGTADAVVPPAQSREVADAAPNLVGVVAVDGADHNDAVLGSGSVVVDAVRRLLPG